MPDSEVNSKLDKLVTDAEPQANNNLNPWSVSRQGAGPGWLKSESSAKWDVPGDSYVVILLVTIWSANTLPKTGTT